MRRRLLFALLVLAACGDDGAATTPATTSTPDASAIGPRLEQAVADELARYPDIPGEILLVDAPDIGFRFVTARGVADGLDGEEPLTPDHEFSIASVTKTFTAATVLRLVEEGTIALDDPIAGLLPAPYPALLEADGYDPGAITVHHLLGHLGGLYDYATDAAYSALAVNDPEHRWTPEEQVRFAMAHGDPLGPPGSGFAYSDTGYVLLGQIIEEATGLGLAESYRSVLDFTALGLEHTHLESLEPAPDPGAPRVANLFAALDLTGTDPSFDLYGGGGLVSTVEDLGRFYVALFDGRVFDDPATLATMTEVSPQSGDDEAALGLFRVEAEGWTCYEHLGFWGTVALHCPEPGLTIVRHVGQALPAGGHSFADLNLLVASLVAQAASR